MTAWARHRHLLTGVTAVVILVLIASMTAYYREHISFAEQRVLEILAPIQQAAFRMGQSLRGTWESLAELKDLRSENARLRAELERLASLEPRVAEYEQENARLREMLNFAAPPEYGALASRVMGRSLSNWFSTVEIDRGSAHGVATGQTVVTQMGLVGRIVRVTPHTATVLLLADPQSGVGTEIIRSREPGALVGNASFSGWCQMKLFSRDADVVTGDMVLTSGLGDIFPRGLPVGTVARVTHGEQGLLTIAEVMPAVDFRRLEEVFVLLPR